MKKLSIKRKEIARAFFKGYEAGCRNAYASRKTLLQTRLELRSPVDTTFPFTYRLVPILKARQDRKLAYLFGSGYKQTIGGKV